MVFVTARSVESYVVVFSRNENAYGMDYAINECYRFNRVGQVIALEPLYTFNKEHLYNGDIVVEDSNSGMDFFSSFCKNVEAASGKTNVHKRIVKEYKLSKLYIADGTAFGALLSDIYPLYVSGKIDLLLPESVEYLFLNSSFFNDLPEIVQAFKNPELYDANLMKYNTWENYFIDLLRKACRYKYMKNYTKSDTSCLQ